MRASLLAAVVLIAACGGDDGDGGGIDASSAIDAAGGGIDAGIDAATGVGAAPVASFTLTPDCTSSTETDITATSTSTDADGDTLTCTWVFQSSTNMSGMISGCTIAGVRFPHIQPYPVTLTVDDGNGNTDMAIMNIGRCPEI